MSPIHSQLSKTALEIGAVTLNASEPYTWASGFRMPIYNDNRLLLSSAETRSLIADGFQNLIQQHQLKCDVIAGTSTSGIPHATTLADRMEKPLVYVRSKAKGHGLQNRIEGRLDAGTPCVLIEDVVSTGGSSLDAVIGLRDAGAEVSACLAIYDYGFKKAQNAFDEAGCPIYSLFTFAQLLDTAVKENFVSEADAELLKDWEASPFEWGERHGFPKVEK